MVDLLDAIQSELQTVNEKGCIDDEVRNGFFRKLRMKNENRTCFDCNTRNPTWISLSHGVFVCLECSGEHRRKGVHISYVRSAELDSFKPEEIVQMACGGNAKGWAHFKAHGMGKLAEGRAIDYTSKPAVRYRQMIEKECQDTCLQRNITCKSGASAATIDHGVQSERRAHPGPPRLGDAIHHPVSSNPSGVSPKMKPTSPTMSRMGPKAASPKLGPAAPTTSVVRKTPAASASIPSPTMSSAAAGCIALELATVAPPKPSGFASSKHQAKDLDFDFDFDELEAEASKPAPPKPVVVASESPSAGKKIPVWERSPTLSATTTNEGGPSPKHVSANAISSDDFFGGFDQNSPQARIDTAMRYEKFGSAGAISSDAFFGNGSEPDRRMSGDDIKVAASNAADAAKKGMTNAKDSLFSILGKS